MGESFSFIESGIIFNTKTKEDLKNHSISVDNFINHGEAYQFLLDYSEDYDKSPTTQLLKERFPDLDTDAIGVGLEHCVRTLHEQSLTRKATGLIRGQNELMIKSPKEAISNIIRGLDGLNLRHDQDVTLYKDESGNRLREYQDRRAQRNNSKLKIIGVPTPIRTINMSGLGMLPGEICSIFARAGVGKSWFCIKAAAICMSTGYKTLFITPEMTVDQMMLRFDVVLGEMKGYTFSHNALKVGDPINEEEYLEFLQSSNGEKDLLVCDHLDKSSINLPGIAALVRKHRPDVLVLDNMEILSPGEASNAMWEKMSNLYFGLKGLCTSAKIVAFVSHQANKGAINPFRMPSVNDVASGDALIRTSDVALSMCCVEEDEKKRYISFQKFRDVEKRKTKSGKEFVTMDFDVDRGLFKEVDLG